MAEGMRVVRGPDWSLGDADGGEGHVGTVTHDFGNCTVEVLWDLGTLSTCKTGQDGKFDIRILDSAPLNIKHDGVMCVECRTEDFTGVRWKCSLCENYDLCTPCYFRDKHEMQHPFKRISAPGNESVLMKKRSISSRSRALGIYPGATVVRGKHWEYGTQDGGPGCHGKVLDVCSSGHECNRNAVRVQWQNGEQKVYRMGCHGKVDLKCIEEAPGIDYYKDHLEVLDTRGQYHKPSASASSSSAYILSSQREFEEGDKVCVELSESALRELQRGHGEWSMRLAQCIGQHGKVKQIETNGDVIIDCLNEEWRFNSQALRKVPSLQLGDIVQIVPDEEKVRTMQRKHGGWSTDMKGALGKCGKIVKIDSDGDVVVMMGNSAFVLNPACCIPSPDTKADSIALKAGNNAFVAEDLAVSTVEAEKRDDDPEENVDVADLFRSMMTQVLHSHQLSFCEEVPSQLISLISAAIDGDASLLQKITEQHPLLVNEKLIGTTALIIACHQGRKDVVDVLLKANADKEIRDVMGNTALLSAIFGRREEIALLLIRSGANTDVVNVQFKKTALHAAAYVTANTALKELLQKTCHPNVKDAWGNTPLHDAIDGKNNIGVSILITHPQINPKIANKIGHCPIHLAAMRGEDKILSMMLDKFPDLKDIQTKEGFTPLHVTAVNNNIAATKTLIKANAFINQVNNNRLTPLHLACLKGYLDMAKLLVENGAAMDIEDWNSCTPLHLCMAGCRVRSDGGILFAGMEMISEQEIRDRVNVACYLISKGASVSCRNNDGKTPLEISSVEKLRNAVAQFVRQDQPEATGSGSNLGTGSHYQGASCSSTPMTSSPRRFQEGDKVCVELPESALQELQKRHGVWNMNQAQCIGQHGVVKQIETNGDVVIESLNNIWRFNPQALRRVPSLQVGDIVQIVPDADKVKAMQRKHGGWSADMKVILGKCGKISKIDSDGDVVVIMGNSAFVLNPACCIPTPDSNVDNIDQPSVKDEKSDDDTRELADVADVFRGMMTQMLLSGQLGVQVDVPNQLYMAAISGDAALVQTIIQQNPSLVNKTCNGITALIIASHQGHKDVVDVLLKANADTETKDVVGNTALIASLLGKREEIALLLMRSGANKAVVGNHGQTALHAAASGCANTALRELLQETCDPNVKDELGDTPLHDSIVAQNYNGASILINHPQINPKIANTKGHCPVHVAAIQNDAESLTIILDKFPNLKDIRAKDGLSPLHLVAINNSIAAAKSLIRANAFINHVNNERLTPLHFACHQGFLDMAKLLIENGANLCVEDNNWNTPLHVCMLGRRKGPDGGILVNQRLGDEEFKDRANLARYLISNGASVNCPNSFGITPLQLCSDERLRNDVAEFAGQQ